MCAGAGDRVYIRCADCGASTRVVFGGIGRGALSCTCTCGRKHSLARVGELGSTPDERYHRALEQSKSLGIDLASAYSVLLGIIPREKALSTRDQSEGSDPGAAKRYSPSVPTEGPLEYLPQRSEPVEARGVPALGEAMYDPGFGSAVAAGFLTVEQAVMRGDRVFWALRIAQKHGLSMGVAFMIADNKVRLDEALREKDRAHFARRSRNDR